jgi:hypothetical protein
MHSVYTYQSLELSINYNAVNRSSSHFFVGFDVSYLIVFESAFEAMLKKKVDDRIRVAIQNGVKTKTRTMLVIVGDRGKEQVVNLHYILSKSEVGQIDLKLLKVLYL